MAQFETWLRSDLSKGMIVRKLAGNLYSGDSGANLIGVAVYNGEEPVTLSGSVYGYVIRSDGVTVIVEGELDGNRAWVELPSQAYAVIGLVSIAIKVGSTTVGACSTSVYRTSTNNDVDPGSVVPDITTLLALIDECEDATAAAEAAADNAVIYSGSQSLTSAQKLQARTNIGAMAATVSSTTLVIS